MSKRAVVYARVSTDEQAERGYSLPTQLEACRRYAGDNEMGIIAEFADDVSGIKPLQERAEGGRLWVMVESGEVEAVVVYRFDRLSRDLIDLHVIARELQDQEIELHVCDLGRIRDDAMGDISIFLFGFKAQGEHRDITERTIRGKYEMARNNRQVLTGYPPYGYRKEGKGNEARLFINEPEAETIRQIFSWYTIGDEDHGPLSLRAIALRLESMGAPTPSGRTNAARYWIPVTIRGILTNEIYTGRTYYGKTKVIRKRGKTKRVKQPREQWIPIDVPDLAIIDQVTFEAAQERAERNRQLATRNRKREYLLSGFMRCGACGGAMAGSAGSTRSYPTQNYRCGTHWHRPERPPCPNENKSIVSKIADQVIWDWLVGLLIDEKNLSDGIQGIKERATAELEPRQRRLTTINKLLDETERKVGRLVAELGNQEDEDIVSAIRKELNTTARLKKDLIAERQRLEAELSQGALSPEMEANILAVAEKLRLRLLEPDYSTKRLLLDVLNVVVTFRASETGRWLDVTCAIRPELDVVKLPPWLESSRR